jgi:hypothetical protein
MNKHTWRLSSHFSDLPQAFDSSFDPAPSAFVDYTCYIGLDRAALRHSGSGDASVMGGVFVGEVYESYPHWEHAERGADDDGARQREVELLDFDECGDGKDCAGAAGGRGGGDGDEDANDDADKDGLHVPPFPMNVALFAFPKGLRCVWSSATEDARAHSFTMTQVGRTRTTACPLPLDLAAGDSPQLVHPSGSDADQPLDRHIDGG